MGILIAVIVVLFFCFIIIASHNEETFLGFSCKFAVYCAAGHAFGLWAVDIIEYIAK